MRETRFIEANEAKWQELEKLNSQKKKDPKRLTELFIEVTNDLSFAKTHYPNRSIRVYLNNLAQSVHSGIYKGRFSLRKKFGEFWFEDLPRVVSEARKDILISFLVFVAAMFVGVFSSIQDPEFAQHILGESYVEMTEEYIASGDPMKVYKTSKDIDMFTYITVNNLRVSFLVFVMGTFFGVGTIMLLIYNGIMVGAFQYFFIERDLFRESFLTIWMHGMPEILSIIIAGAAGLTLGRGLLFPGTFGRTQSFLIGARRGIMIMIGVSPIFIFAGFIEGFATRYTDIPDGIRLACILLSAAFMVYYFVIYPWRKFSGADSRAARREKIPEDIDHHIQYQTDKTNGAIYLDVFALFRAGFFGSLPFYFGASVLYCIVVGVFATHGINGLMPQSSGMFAEIFLSSFGEGVMKVDSLFNYQSEPYLFIINSFFFTAVVLRAMWDFRKCYDKDTKASSPTGKAFVLRNVVWMICIAIVANALFFIPTPLSFLLMVATMPMLLMAAANVELSDITGMPFKQNFRLMLGAYGKSLGLFTLMLITSILFLLVSNSELVPFLIEVTLWNFQLESELYTLILAGIRLLLTILTLALVTPLFVHATCLGYLSAHEVSTAKGLHTAVGEIGVQKKAFGLLREDA